MKDKIKKPVKDHRGQEIRIGDFMVTEKRSWGIVVGQVVDIKTMVKLRFERRSPDKFGHREWDMEDWFYPGIKITGLPFAPERELNIDATTDR